MERVCLLCLLLAELPTLLLLFACLLSGFRLPACSRYELKLELPLHVTWSNFRSRNLPALWKLWFCFSPAVGISATTPVGTSPWGGFSVGRGCLEHAAAERNADALPPHLPASGFACHQELELLTSREKLVLTETGFGIL